MDHRLRQELLEMQEEDQQTLRELVDADELQKVEYHPRMRSVHERNNARIKEIVSDYGWPGVRLVAKESAKYRPLVNNS